MTKKNDPVLRYMTHCASDDADASFDRSIREIHDVAEAQVREDAMWEHVTSFLRRYMIREGMNEEDADITVSQLRKDKPLHELSDLVRAIQDVQKFNEKYVVPL